MNDLGMVIEFPVITGLKFTSLAVYGLFIRKIYLGGKKKKELAAKNTIWQRTIPAEWKACAQPSMSGGQRNETEVCGVRFGLLPSGPPVRNTLDLTGINRLLYQFSS